MWKKAVPVMALCSVLLVGCNMDKTVPSGNETPMEDIKDDTKLLTPDVNTPSPDTTIEDKNVNPNGTTIEDKTVNPNGTTNEEIITDPNATNPNGTTGNEEIIKDDVKINTK